MVFTVPNISPEDMKEIVKAAIKEWLDEQKAEFGSFSIKWMIAALFAGGVYLFLMSQGWHK